MTSPWTSPSFVVVASLGYDGHVEFRDIIGPFDAEPAAEAWIASNHPEMHQSETSERAVTVNASVAVAPVWSEEDDE